ncbi:unnamed protein product [Moneuplotes crassus]|uniref:Uncharacterized protein n=1 Tax=Euplotes crassus TaxID=5936 RepID=A0AAD1XS70_EUPCR|nr:unnamed protein product [Moneuplotes crassus]
MGNACSAKGNKVKKVKKTSKEVERLKEIVKMKEEKIGQDVGKEDNSVGDDYFRIDVRDQWCLDLLAEGRVMPKEFKSIHISHFQEENEEINQFLTNSVRHDFDILELNRSGEELDINFYIESITDALKHVRKEVKLYYFTINAQNLSDIISSIPKLTGTLSFPYCTIDLSDSFAPTVSSPLSKLSFKNTELSTNFFENFIPEISGLPSLKSLVCEEEQISKQEITDLCTKNSLQDLEICFIPTLNLNQSLFQPPKSRFST